MASRSERQQRCPSHTGPLAAKREGPGQSERVRDGWGGEKNRRARTAVEWPRRKIWKRPPIVGPGACACGCARAGRRRVRGDGVRARYRRASKTFRPPTPSRAPLPPTAPLWVSVNFNLRSNLYCGAHTGESARPLQHSCSSPTVSFLAGPSSPLVRHADLRPAAP